MQLLVDLAKHQPLVVCCQKPSHAALTGLLKVMDEKKPMLVTSAQKLRTAAGSGVLAEKPRNEAEANDAKGKAAKRSSDQKGSSGESPPQRNMRARGVRGKAAGADELEAEPELEAKRVHRPASFGVAGCAGCGWLALWGWLVAERRCLQPYVSHAHRQGDEAQKPALNLAELMSRASNPAPIVSGTTPAADSTLMAVHMQQSTELAELKKEVEKERTLRQEKEAEAVSLRLQLTQKEAELAGVKLAAEQTATVAAQLAAATERAAGAEAALKEQSKSIKELKKREKQQQAAVFAMANVKYGKMKQFVEMADAGAEESDSGDDS